MASHQPVRVAINAQINPDSAGGVESSAASIMNYYRGRADAVRMTILALPEYRERFRALVGPDHAVEAWTHAQERPVTPDVQRPLLKSVQARLGPLRPLFDGAVLARKRQLLRQHLGTRAENDAALAALGVEVVHFPYGSTFATSLPTVFEPHDIQHRHHPEFFDRYQLEYRDRVYGDGCRGAAMVVCGSRWTKTDIMEQFGVASERIAVVPRSSVNARAALPEARRQAIGRELGLPERFAFYPAMTFPHKNHVRLFEALARLRDERSLVVPLVMTGRSYDPHQPQVLQAIGRFGLGAQVRMLGVVPDDTLSALFRSAAFLLFPSLYEGLSQSLLESLHVGLPVVAAQQSSIPETVGPSALLFDGLSVPAMAEAVAQAYTRPDLLDAQRAPAQRYYNRYSWDRAGPMLTAVYRHAAGQTLDAGDRPLLDEAVSL